MDDLSRTSLAMLIARCRSWQAEIGTRSRYAEVAPKIVAELTAEIERRDTP